MPHQKQPKQARNNVARADNNNNVQNRNAANVNNGGQAMAGNTQRMQHCCMPGTCTVKEELIDTEDVGDAVRVVCNNEDCNQGNWMHKSCFEDWEQTVLAYLRSCGRARSWSEKQRLQNLWTKKGYDLAFKACDCNCSKGHLRKDLDYIKPVRVDNGQKKKSKKKVDAKPALNTAVHNTHPAPGHVRERRPSGNNNTNANHALVRQVSKDNSDQNGNAMHVGSPLQNGHGIPHQNGHGAPHQNGHGTPHQNDHGTPHQNGHSIPHQNGHSIRSNGVGTSIRKTSPSITILNKHNDLQRDDRDRIRANSISSTGSSPPNSASYSASSATSGSNSPVPPSPQSARAAMKQRFEFEAAPSPSSSPSNTVMNSLFRKRSDLSAFNVLPKHKQNPYHIKMEDDVAPGTDDVHLFVLNHLGNYKISSLNCVLCKNELCIFEKYPLIDGTLFLSPQSYDNQALRVIADGRLQYINAVCVNCLEGSNDIRCASCKRKWDGSSLLLGSMYSYDIFAAMPCCQKRLTCKHCRRAVVDVSSGLQYFSEYSHMIPCPYCKAYDYHFVRPLNETFAMKISIWH